RRVNELPRSRWVQGKRAVLRIVRTIPVDSSMGRYRVPFSAKYEHPGAPGMTVGPTYYWNADSTLSGVKIATDRWSRTYGFDRWNRVCEYRSGPPASQGRDIRPARGQIRRIPARPRLTEWRQFYDTEGRLLGACLYGKGNESIAYWLGEEMPERDVQVLVQEYDAYTRRFSWGPAFGRVHHK
ncbi:MAG TPA: hypothetical protein VFP10_10000, partial [Candidatus Eisenbacteria bacterium]|nr:hypothetical protein [Candidatus Eisenbacteria bacterium]